MNSNYNNIDEINIATNQYITSFNINNNSSDNSSYIFKKNPLDSTILNKLKPVEIKDENQKSKIEYNCVICKEKYKLRDKYIILPCKHIFHEHCIKTWFKQSNICPICKSKIDINDTNNENRKNNNKLNYDNFLFWMICLNFMNFSNSIIGKNDDYKYSNNINTKFKKYFFVGFGLIINNEN